MDLDEAGDRTARGSPLSADLIDLRTVGIDVGSSTSHLLISRLRLMRQNQTLSSRFAVAEREILYASPILLTPYIEGNRIDAAALADFIADGFKAAEIDPEDIDTGAVILTGEAIKRENARAIADVFAADTGKFVCASAGHNFEAILSAYGSGAVRQARITGRSILNVDIGGGTSKLTMIDRGRILGTATINVGGRLLAFDTELRLTRMEDAARIVADELGLSLEVGRIVRRADLALVAGRLADALLEAVRGAVLGPLASKLMLTPELARPVAFDVLTFSGGVAEYLYGHESRDFGDIAQLLAAAVQERIDAAGLQSFVRESAQRIRATVIGAAQFTVQVSGSTIHVSAPDLLPLRNLQVVRPTMPRQPTPGTLAASIRTALGRFDVLDGDRAVALMFEWSGDPSYRWVRWFTEELRSALPQTLDRRLPLVMVFDRDVGKLLGSVVEDELAADRLVVSVDGLQLREFEYIDIGKVLQPSGSVPVAIKSLLFPHAGVS